MPPILGEPWTDSVQTAGKLGGYDPNTGAACSEGFVIRNAADFATNNGNLPVQSNEFDNLFNWCEPNTLKPMFIGRKLGSLPVLSITTNTIGKAGSFQTAEVQLSNNKKDNYVDIPILHTRSTPDWQALERRFSWVCRYEGRSARP